MDARTFDALYAERAEDMTRQVALMLGDLSVAEDGVAGAYARGWALAESGDADADALPTSWLRTEALHQARAAGPLLQHRRRRPSGSVPLPGSDPDAALVAALLALPTAQRTAYVLHHLAGVGVSEVAVEMESTAITARARIAEAAAVLGAAAGTPADRHGAAALIRRVQGIAAALPVQLPPADQVRTVRATTEHQRMLATTAAVAVGVLAVLVWVIGVAVNHNEPPAFAADPTTAVTPVARTPTPTPTPAPTPLASPTASDGASTGPPRPGEGPDLPRALVRPTAEHLAGGRRHDLGYLKTAFTFGGTSYLVFDRAHASGTNVSIRMRDLAVDPRLTVLGGRWLGGQADDPRVSTADFLTAVASGSLSDVAVRLTYSRGGVRHVEPYEPNGVDGASAGGADVPAPRSTGRVAFPR